MGLDTKACALLKALRESLIADGQPDYRDEKKSTDGRPKKAALTPTQKRRSRRKRAEAASGGSSNTGKS